MGIMKDKKQVLVLIAAGNKFVLCWSKFEFCAIRLEHLQPLTRSIGHLVFQKQKV